MAAAGRPRIPALAADPVVRDGLGKTDHRTTSGSDRRRIRRPDRGARVRGQEAPSAPQLRSGGGDLEGRGRRRTARVPLEQYAATAAGHRHAGGELMLAPADRRLLLDVLAPPGGYTLDHGVGTTYMLDL